MVGPGLWDPPGAEPVELPAGRPAAGRSSPAPRSSRTTARSPPRRWPGCATATASSSPPPGSTRPRSATPATRSSSASSPTAEILPHADVVVCHGGMGVTQKALSFGVPVCVVPWGRDQLDVAAHVLEAGSGDAGLAAAASPPPGSPPRSRRRAPAAPARRGSRPATRRPAAPSAAADALEALVTQPAHR